MTPMGWRRQPQSGKEDSNAPWQRSHRPYKKPPMRKKRTTALRHIYDNTREKSPTWKDRLQKTITRQKQCKDKQPTYCTRTQKEKKKKKKKKEEKAGMLATIFGWPKEATLEDRKLNARWFIDQSGVKDENITMTFTDKKGRLSNYARLRFSNQGLRDRSSLPWSNSLRQSWHQRCKRRGWLFGTWRPDAPGDIKVWFKEKTEEKLNNLMFNVFKFYGYGPEKFFITSPLTISVSSVQLVKLLEKTLRNGQIVSRIWREVGWRSSNATSYFHRYVDVFSIGKDHWVDAHNRSVHKLDENISDQWIER